MAIPKSCLNQFTKILKEIDIEDIEHLQATLTKTPFIVSEKYHEWYDKEERYCLFSIMGGINKSAWHFKSDLEKSWASLRYAEKCRGEDPIAIEEYLKDRVFTNKQKIPKIVMDQNEINEILYCCKQVLISRTVAA